MLVSSSSSVCWSPADLKANSLVASYKVFTPEEDQIIVNCVKRYGENWKLISQYVSTKDARQCRNRYLCFLKKDQDTWTDREDDFIREMYFKYGPRWELIASFCPGKSSSSIKARCRILCRKGCIKSPSDPQVIKNSIALPTVLEMLNSAGL